MSAVTDAIENLRQALLDEGEDPGTVEAKLNMVKPAETNLVGNFADLQRVGALVADRGVANDTVLEAAVALPADVDDENGATADVDSMTKAELQAELDARGIEYPSSATKAELQELLG